MIFKYTIEQAREMANREPRLQDVIDRLGMIEREMEPDLYLGVIKSIVSQQISTGAYQTIWNKIAELAKEVRPDTIAALSRESLQACGLSWRKVDYILEFSQAVVAGVVDLDYLAGLPNEEFVKELVKIRGIGPWTARMILIFTLGRLDVISFDDLAIIRGLKATLSKRYPKQRRNWSILPKLSIPMNRLPRSIFGSCPMTPRPAWKRTAKPKASLRFILAAWAI